MNKSAAARQPHRSAEENRMPPEIYPTPDAVAGTLHVAIMWRAASIIIFRAGSMTARACSGSRSCWSSVEPLISAKSAVTVLRSPSRCSGAVVSAIRIGPSEDSLTDAGADAAIAVPHFLQNRAPELTAALHAGQTSSSFDPPCSQNVASGGLSVLQEEHCMALGAQLVEQRLCIFEVGGVEALGEPVVDFGEHRARMNGSQQTHLLNDGPT